MRCSRALVVWLVVVSTMLAVGEALAQHQYDRWYFGFKHGLDFRTSPPTLLTDGQTNTIEGSAVYCDPKTGDLLFYTDGVMVWDRMHRLMPNGKDLIADQSSTQAALIVPDPAEPKRFYVFHCDQSGYTRPTKGVYYSVVDLRLNGGYGDVALKNQKLIHEGTEKLTAISICGGEAYWVIAHELITNTFVAWFLDASGLSLVPVKTGIGANAGPSPVAGAGYLAASPDGQFIASVTPSPSTVEIFKFDFESGKLYDLIQLPAISKPYGVSFSPDSRKIYVSGERVIAQYDISRWDSLTIARSRYDIKHYGRSEGALRLGPDQKIYIQESDSLGVIQFPNLLRAECGYTPAVYPLKPSGQFGLPNNIDALGGHDCKMPLARIAQHQTNFCEGTCINFKDSSRFAPTSWVWLFEGGSPSISRERNPKNICFETAGTHNVTLIAYNDSGSDTARTVVKVRTCPVPVVALRDTTICISECVTFKDTSTLATSWQWTFENAQPATYSGRTPPQVCFYRIGDQKVTLVASNQYGSTTATARVQVRDCTVPIAQFTHDTATCSGTSLNFTNRSRNVVTKYAWTFAGGTPATSSDKDPKNIYYAAPGEHQVTLIASNDIGSDTAISTVHALACAKPTAILADATVCQGDFVNFIDSSKGDPTYWKWSFEGASVASSTLRNPGKVYYKKAGVFPVQLIVGNAQGEDTVTSSVAVSGAFPTFVSSLNIPEKIVACTTLDTAIWIKAGCQAGTITNLTSIPALSFAQTQFDFVPDQLIRVPVSISHNEIGEFATTIDVTVNENIISIPCKFSITHAPESFTYSFSSDPFVAGHCAPTSRKLLISNDACTPHSILDVRVASSTSATPFSTDFVKGSSILPTTPSEITITYDPTLAGSTDAELILTTASGKETTFSLRGIRNDLPQARIGLGQPSAPSLTAGDELSLAVQFETAIGDTAAPEQVSLLLAYNTDMLSLASIEPPLGWTVTESIEGADALHLTMSRVASAVAAGDSVARLRFKSYLTGEESTDVTIASAVCNPDNEGFGTCTLETKIGESSTVTVSAGCGVTELRKALTNVKSVSVTVHPNPVVSADGQLKVHIASLASESEPLHARIELIDLQGRSTLLDERTLRFPGEDVSVMLPGIAAGSYVLRTQVGGESVSSQIILTR